MIPYGESPLAGALKKSKEILNKNNRNYIILFSAGVETCGGNPVSTAKELKSEGYISRIFCIGFGENNLLREIAKNTSGIYYNVTQFTSLKSEILKEIYGKNYNVAFSQSKAVFSGKIGYRNFIKKKLQVPAYGTEMTLKDLQGNIVRKMKYWRGIIENIPPGKYIIQLTNSGQNQQDSIIIRPGDFIIKNFIFDIETGNLTFKHLIEGAPEGKAYGTFTQINHENGETIYTGTRWSGTLQDLPIAKYTIIATNSSITKKKTIILKPNKTEEVTFSFSLKTGRIAYKCFMDTEKRKIAYGTTVKIFRLPIEELAFESSDQWRGTTSLIPPGNYRIEGEYQGIVKKENVYVAPDSTVNYDFIFNIRKIKLSYKCYRNKAKSPANGTIMEIFNSKGVLVEQLQGWRGSILLPEGSYLLRAQYQGKLISRNIDLFLKESSTFEQEFYFSQ